MTLEELKELKHPKCFYTKEETDAILKSISQKVVVEQLPEYGKEGYLYLMPSIADPNVYEQFIWNNDTWESLGTVNKEEYLDYVTNPELNIALGDKQDKLTFDSAPTYGSSNPVTSDGLAQYFNGVDLVLMGLNMNNAIVGVVGNNNRVTFYRAVDMNITNPISPADVLAALQRNTSFTIGLIKNDYIISRLHVGYLTYNNDDDELSDGVVLIGPESVYPYFQSNGYAVVSVFAQNAIYVHKSTLSELDNVPVDSSDKLVTSGGVYTALQGKQDVSPITNTASGALTVNEYRDFGTVSALTVTLSGGTMTNYDLYKFAFTCVSDSTTLTLPSGIKLPVDMEMEMATGRRFECVIDYAGCLTYNCWD